MEILTTFSSQMSEKKISIIHILLYDLNYEGKLKFRTMGKWHSSYFQWGKQNFYKSGNVILLYPMPSYGQRTGIIRQGSNSDSRTFVWLQVSPKIWPIIVGAYNFIIGLRYLIGGFRPSLANLVLDRHCFYLPFSNIVSTTIASLSSCFFVNSIVRWCRNMPHENRKAIRWIYERQPDRYIHESNKPGENCPMKIPHTLSSIVPGGLHKNFFFDK